MKHILNVRKITEQVDTPGFLYPYGKLNQLFNGSTDAVPLVIVKEVKRIIEKEHKTLVNFLDKLIEEKNEI